MKGVYCLLISCRKPQSIRIGKLGVINFRKGFYLYVGSALNGIEGRVSRHLRSKKRKFWHIDYFLSNKYVNVDYVYCIETEKKIECDIAKKVRTTAKPVMRFGSSDCRCGSHLFFVYNREQKRNNFVFV